MDLEAFSRRLDRLAARFNKWFTPAALAGNVEGPGRPASIDETRVTIILGEIEGQGERRGLNGFLRYGQPGRCRARRLRPPA
jgi:hypothetical protein